MEKKFTIRMLMILSLLIIGTLSSIQYYLIHNTYELTKEKYYTEVKKKTTQLMNAAVVDSLEDKLQENLKQVIIHAYEQDKLNKKVVFQSLKDSNHVWYQQLNGYIYQNLQHRKDLRNIQYKSQYEEIIIEKGGVLDTLLSSTDVPVMLFGNKFNDANTLLLNHNETVSVVNKNMREKQINYSQNLKLIVRTSNYINVSDWKKAVFSRMLGTFTLGATLIIAVISLLYMVFSAMIRQKKIADIKTDFANNITHELKTPLSSVSLILKSMGRDDVKANNVLQDDLLQSLNRQYLKIQHIVDSVLEGAMLSEIPVQLEPLDMHTFLENYVHDLRLKSHQLAVDIDPASCLLHSSPLFIEKILNVLVENAQKYSAPQTVIKLESAINGKYYTIAVTDEGPGITADHQAHIFDKFYRVPEENRHSVKGLGLGLFLARQAADRIQAKLELKSKAGKGSSFLIHLPL